MTKIERFILNFPPIVAVRNISKRITLPGFEGLKVFDVYQFLIAQINREGLNIRAAAISYNFVMAIPAAMLFLCTLIPYFPVSNRIFHQLILMVNELTPDENARKILTHFLDNILNKPQTGLLSLGFILTLFYSSNAMMGIMRAFDKSQRVRARTNFIEKRIRAIKLTSILFGLLIGSLLISLGQGELFKRIMNLSHIRDLRAHFWFRSLRWVFIVTLFFYSVGFIYKYAPTFKNKQRGRLITPGVVLATLLMILSTTVFGYWAQNISNYNKFYGSIGSMMILMLLIFINSLMLLIGYELNISIRYLKEEQEALL